LERDRVRPSSGVGATRSTSRVSGLAKSSTRDNEGQDTAEPGVHEREGHHPMLTGSGAECQLRALIGILGPFNLGRFLCSP
jgi:hypothetical protein